MESLIQFGFENVNNIHIIGFFLIMLGGINVPISEDIIMISTGAIVGTIMPEKAYYIFAWLFFACWFSAWEAYWIGRAFGPKLYDIKWFNWIINRQRIEKINKIYERFGSLVFFIGRFIPGGIRNCLFMTSGLGKMPFYKFILRDVFACLLTASFLYSLGYFFGQHYKVVVHYFKIYHNIALYTIITAVILTILLRLKKAWMF